MKTITLLALATLFIASASNAATNSLPASPLVKELQETIKYPENVEKKSKSETVLVSFIVDVDGKVGVLQTNASNEEISQSVRQQMEKMTMDVTTVQPYKVYDVKINFKIKD